MTVKELIEKLGNCDSNADVYWGGVTAGIPKVDDVEDWGTRVWLLNKESEYN